MALTLAQAAFVGLLLEMILYGAYLVLFVAHVKILWRRRSKDWTYYYQMGTAVALLVALTLHTGVEMAQSFEAYTGDKPAAALLTDMALPLNRVKIALWVTSVCIGDLFLVYRVYVIWGFDPRPALLPLALWCALLGVAGWCVHAMAHLPPSVHFSESVHGGFSSTTAEREGMSCPIAKFPIMFTLIVNAVCSVLIAGKLWHMQTLTADVYSASSGRSSSGSIGGGGGGKAVNGRNPVVRALVIVVESASIQMAALAAQVTLATLGSPYGFMMLAITAPLMGVLNAMIIVRSSAAREQHNTTVSSTQSNVHGMQFRPRRLTLESRDTEPEGMHFEKRRESDLSFAAV